MDYLPNAIAAAGDAGGGHSPKQILDWRLAREAHKELRAGGLGRTNLFLVGNGAVSILLDMLDLGRQSEPVVQWRPGQALELPSPERAATLVLHGVHRLEGNDQQRLLRWLDQSDGRIRVVSTATEPLWPRVQQGAFNAALYYRLNIVYVDVGSVGYSAV